MQIEDKKLVYDSFKNGSLLTLSCSEDKIVEWKKVTDVMQHDVSEKKQYRVETITGKKCEVTEDHSLFMDKKEKIAPLKTSEFKEGDPLVIILKEVCSGEPIKKLKEIPRQKYMYDLSVEDNHNFVLDSGILAHNSFRPPAHEKFIQAQTQVFGYIWEDYELYEYILMALDYFNSAPPVTGVDLNNIPSRWRTSVLLGAAAHACMAIAMNWISDEFSVSGSELVSVQDKDGIEHTLPIEDLFDIIYEDMFNDIKKRVKEEYAESIEELENENI